MKARTLTCLAAVVACWLAMGTAHSQELFSKLVGDVKTGDVKTGDVIEVPFILWGGDVATFHANGGLETKPDTIFKKEGLNLKLTPGDDFVAQVKGYLEGKTPFLRGTLSMLGQASEVLGANPKTKPVVFLQLTWSNGDHMVARPTCKTLNDLVGKKIALQKNGPHAGMLNDILNTIGKTWKDVTIVWTDDVTGPKGPTELFKKDTSIDACFAITPDMMSLTGGLTKTGTGAEGTVKDAKVLVSTATMNRSIADVYAVRKDFFDAHKDIVEKFAAGYLKGAAELVDLKDKYNKKDAEASKKYKAILKMTQDIYGKEAIPGEPDADGLISDAAFVGIVGNVVFFKTAGNTTGFKEKQKAALDLAVALGNAKEKKEFLDANLDYEALNKLGDIKADLSAATKPTERHTGELPMPGADPLENAIYFFTISFDPDQDQFEEMKYGKDFDKAVRDASLFGNSVVAIRGHADLAKVIGDYVKAAMKKGMLKAEGEGASRKYSLKDGTPLKLEETAKVLKLIRDGDFTGADEDPKNTLKAVEDLSNKRAETVRQAVLKYAKDHNLRLDPSQLKAVGVGVSEPAVPLPRTKEQMASNRRVEFRIVKVPAEAVSEVPY
jgi:ABC-type nitrate/sulfonate/bicarbonate transport system substrate-binding protein/outer membrane protein OmpA-like peptidoglycan-associated protein